MGLSPKKKEQEEEEFICLYNCKAQGGILALGTAVSKSSNGAAGMALRAFSPLPSVFMQFSGRLSSPG